MNLSKYLKGEIKSRSYAYLCKHAVINFSYRITGFNEHCLRKNIVKNYYHTKNFREIFSAKEEKKNINR